MSYYRALKLRRAKIKGQVTRIVTFFDTEEVRTAADAQIRLGKLEEYWAAYDAVQTEIEFKSTEDDRDFAQQQEDSEAERAIFVTGYYRAAAMAQAVINRDRVARENENANNRQGENAQQGQEIQMHRPKLPEMKLPEFNGEALKVVQGYKISNENYAHAWKLLKDTYDNKTIIIESHLDELLDFPVITKENKAESIRQFVWHIRRHMTSLEALGQPVDQWATVILHLAKKKIDFAERRDWQNLIKNRAADDMPTMEEFLKFLTDCCNTLRVLNLGKEKQTYSKHMEKKKTDKKVALTVTKQECKICKGSHSIYGCEDLQKLSPADRKKEVLSKRLCVNCLGAGHFAKECKRSSCRKCGSRHNTLLHQETDTQPEVEEGAVITYYAHRPTTNVVLSTARVHVYDIEGNPHVCRALLDSGSQSNLITESFVRKLKLRSRTEHRPISGINQSKTSAGKVAEIRIEAIHGDFTESIECLLLPTITKQLPQNQIDIKQMLIPKDVQLADPVFNKPDKIDLQIGAGLFWKIVVGTPKIRARGQPALQNTRLGWIFGGEISETRPSSSATHLSVTNDVLNQQIERFWRQEELPKTLPYTNEEKYCEEYFVETVKRDREGRFIVRLPKRENAVLGDSYEQALRRFLALERRFARNAEIKQEYVRFMDDYLQQNHMSLSKDNESRGPESYVLPHQAVVRPDSVTTKLRVVFDASAKTTLGTSLNDKLIPGPNLQRDLIDIILRFRAYRYVMTADVAMMYRQIVVDERDRALQRILWRRSPQETVNMYDLNTVTYGTNCAPFLAIRCLRELAAEARDLEKAAKAVNEECYMDDVLTGANTIDEAVELQKRLSELLSRGNFQLRKWRANDDRILEHLTEACKTDGLLTEVLKTLGLLWNAEEDYLQYCVKIENNNTATKRIILSKIAQVFDPLGLLAPLLITGKIIMQRLWLFDTDWDQSLPEKSRAACEIYYSSLSRINELRISRNIVPGNTSEKFDIFGFGDASEKAFGACLYAVSVDVEGKVHSHLICAKSKVAPLKTISMPRLELDAALLLANIYTTVKTAYGDRIRNVKLWSDSTIVLGWLRTQPNALKTFVANRISKIQALTPETTWYHVPSEDNPADMISRRIPIERLLDDELWWHGPPWITHGNPWPEAMKLPDTELPELRPATVTLTATTASSILEKYSSYRKLTRVVAYCLRWRSEKQNYGKNGALTVDELEKAGKTVAKMVQHEVFANEIRDLEKHNEVQRKSLIRALNPILDVEGLIRVGGRLRNAELSEAQRHQIILPSKHFITNLIMKEEHLRLHHCPPAQLLNSVRHKFWPLGGLREAHKAIKACLPCYRFRPHFPEVKMGDLPAQRVCGFVRPFVTTMTRGLTLTYEEYSTLLAEIEAILNSRPLTPLSSDPADLSVLTPSHFLIGDPLLQPVQRDFQQTPDNRLSRWEHLQKLRQNFWRRWQNEYLQELQKRSKWSRDGANIELNTLVLLKEETYHRFAGYSAESSSSFQDQMALFES